MAAFVEGFKTDAAAAAAHGGGPVGEWQPPAALLSMLDLDHEQVTRLQGLGQGGGLEAVVHKLMGA
jgi:hypothetical protein